MKKIIVWVFISMFSMMCHAEIKVAVEPAKIALGDTVRLVLSQDDPQNGGVPDLTVLQNDFVIVGTQRNVNYSIINGQSQSLSQWIVTLRPKKEGTLTIPAIQIGIDQSQPSTVVVEKGAVTQDETPAALENKDLLLRAEVEGKKFYIDQQIIYKVTLYNSKRLLDAEYQGPQVDNALIIPLGEAKRYQTIQNNVNFVVEEQIYAIFPQKSGSLTIKSPKFTALIYDLNPQKVTVQDDPVTLNVLPIPKGYTTSQWLPAKQVKLSETYEDSTQKLSQGSTLTRTVTLESIGIPAQLLPNLDFGASNAFKIYPEKGSEQNKVLQGELISTKQIKVTYLFNTPGKATLPELKIRWFNTQTGKEEQSTLPPRIFEITPSAEVNPNALTTNTAPLMQENNKSLDQDVAKAPEAKSSFWPWLLAFLFAFFWIVTLLLWLLQRRSRFNGKGQYKASLDALNQACKECNPSKARAALIQWARLHWPDAVVLNLNDLINLARDAHLKKQLNILSQVLYKSERKALWRGDELWRAVQAIKRNGTSTKKNGASLPPINPF